MKKTIIPMRLHVLLAAFIALESAALAQTSPLKTYPTDLSQRPEEIWTKADLFAVPNVYPASETGLAELPGVKAIFYDGVPYQGKPSRVFAWLGMPANARGPVPGVVLVHGGGGTAFRDWVKAWVDRGYAAIAMDLTGCVPVKPEGVTMDKAQHAYAPKKFTHGGFADIDEPLNDQWFYHAVAAVTRGHSLLAAQKNVDPNRIGVTGSSWGGVLTILAMGVDPRFKFAAPVYGCGFLGENSSWLGNTMQAMPPEKAQKWVRLWDPGHYVGRTQTPVLFCNGTNDVHFRPDSWKKTYEQAKGPVTLSFKVRMGHGHYPDGDPKEITAFANSLFLKQEPLAEVTGQGRDDKSAWIEFSDSRARPVARADLNYTQDKGDWVNRRWMTAPAALDAPRKKASAQLPKNVTAYYFNVVDGGGCIVSSPHVEMDPAAGKSAAPLAEVETIKWDAPVPISGESDVNTEGEQVFAYTLGNTSGQHVAVKGVDFRAVSHTDALESISQTGATGYGILRPSDLQAEPFSALPAEYRAILGRYWYGASRSVITLTFEDLKPETNYLVQFWVSDNQAVHRSISTNFSVGTEISGDLQPNDTGAVGGVGQTVVGRFRTGSQPSAITIATNGGGHVNAMQLRKLP